MIIAIFQLASCYGLLSTESISSPLPSGEWMNVYFYPGFRYVAFPARSSEDVRMHLYESLKQYCILQVATVTFYVSRPEFLVYHEHIFHVMDLKVLNCYLQSDLLFFITIQICQCQDLGFGIVDEIMIHKEHLPVCAHTSTSLKFHTAEMSNKVINCTE